MWLSNIKRSEIQPPMLFFSSLDAGSFERVDASSITCETAVDFEFVLVTLFAEELGFVDEEDLL